MCLCACTGTAPEEQANPAAEAAAPPQAMGDSDAGPTNCAGGEE